MSWDAELLPYCDGTYRVLRRVTRQIAERTGKMIEMKGACIVLESVVCQAVQFVPNDVPQADVSLLARNLARES
jgi:hypothetical protein